MFNLVLIFVSSNNYLWIRWTICLLNLFILLSEMASFWSTKKFFRSWSFFNTSLSFSKSFKFR